MKPQLLEWLACPACQGPFDASPSAFDPAGMGSLQCRTCALRVPVVRGIPRFVESDGYVKNFSVEWTRFKTTQLDRNGTRASAQRFQQSLDVPLAELRGKRVLDAGCGMGRFADVVAAHGGTVVGVDLSYSVDAAAENLAGYDRAHVLQADLRRLPLRPGSFDVIYSLGVLHHTPDPRGTFQSLMPLLAPGGKISITLYSGYNQVYVASTNFWRRLTTRLPIQIVYGLSHLAIPLYHLYKIPVLGLIGKAVWPISLHPDPEWRLLDTFDCYTPKYQFSYTHYEVYRWFQEVGLREIAVLEPGISFIGTLEESRPDAIHTGRRSSCTRASEGRFDAAGVVR